MFRSVKYSSISLVVPFSFREPTLRLKLLLQVIIFSSLLEILVQVCHLKIMSLMHHLILPI